MSDYQRILELTLPNEVKMALIQKHMSDSTGSFDYKILITGLPDLYYIQKDETHAQAKIIDGKLMIFNVSTDMKTLEILHNHNRIIPQVKDEVITYLGNVPTGGDAFLTRSKVHKYGYIFGFLENQQVPRIFYYNDTKCYLQTTGKGNVTESVDTPIGKFSDNTNWNATYFTETSIEQIVNAFISCDKQYVDYADILFLVLQKGEIREITLKRNSLMCYDVMLNGVEYVAIQYVSWYLTPKSHITETMARVTVEHPTLREYINKGYTFPDGEISYSHYEDASIKHIIWINDTKSIYQAYYDQNTKLFATHGIRITEGSVAIYSKATAFVAYGVRDILSNIKKHPQLLKAPGPYFRAYIMAVCKDQITLDTKPIEKIICTDRIEIHYTDGTYTDLEQQKQKKEQKPKKEQRTPRKNKNRRNKKTKQI